MQNLSYEAAPSHTVVVVVRNVMELVGPSPVPASTATVTVLVQKAAPPPRLEQESYEANVPVNTPAGSFLLTIQPAEAWSKALR